MSRPWLSVIMPTYNGAEYLPQALACLRNCSPGMELVAIDDGSTDATVDLLEQYGRDHPLQLIRLGHGGNWVANSNHGLSASRGEYSCFLHQDDTWLPGRLGILHSLITRYPEAALFVHPAWFIGPSGERLGPWRCPFPDAHQFLPAEMVLRKLLVQNCFAMPAPLFRCRDAVEMGGMDEQLWYTADWDLWLRLAAKGGAIYHPEPLAAFRLHSQSQTAKRTSDMKELRRQLETVLDRHLRGFQNNSQFAVTASAARLSVECNLWLAACHSRQTMSPIPLIRAAIAAGPAGFTRYLRDSQIVERTVARLRLSRPGNRLAADFFDHRRQLGMPIRSQFRTDANVPRITLSRICSAAGD